MARENEDCTTFISLVFSVGLIILVIGSYRLSNEQAYIHGQKQSSEVLTFMNVSHQLCSEKVCENTEMPRDQLTTKCADIGSNLNLYQPGQIMACNDGFVCLTYQTVDWTTCYNLQLVNTSQIDCYNTYNCKSISKPSNGINYELECETYGLLDRSTDCKCSQNQPSVCQLPIDQFSYNCNGQKRCTQPIHDRKCRIQVSECYTIKAERGFTTSDEIQVMTSDQTLTCKSPGDASCPQSQMTQFKQDRSIWYQSTDSSDWRYDPYNPNEASNITMICFGGVFILILICPCIGVFVYACVKTQPTDIQTPSSQLPIVQSSQLPIVQSSQLPIVQSSQSNEKVGRSHESSIELSERSYASSEISIQVSKHSSSQSQLS